jgi:hypothetical protein
MCVSCFFSFYFLLNKNETRKEEMKKKKTKSAAHTLTRELM